MTEIKPIPEMMDSELAEFVQECREQADKKEAKKRAFPDYARAKLLELAKEAAEFSQHQMVQGLIGMVAARDRGLESQAVEGIYCALTGSTNPEPDPNNEIVSFGPIAGNAETAIEGYKAGTWEGAVAGFLTEAEVSSPLSTDNAFLEKAAKKLNRMAGKFAKRNEFDLMHILGSVANAIKEGDLEMITAIVDAIKLQVNHPEEPLEMVGGEKQEVDCD